MFDARMVIDMAPAIDVIQAIEQGFAMPARKIRGDIVARKARAERHGVGIEYRSAILEKVQRGKVKRLRQFLMLLQVRHLREHGSWAGRERGVKSVVVPV